MNLIRNFINKHYKVVVFLIGLSIIFLDLLICNKEVMYGDANGYDIMANYFKQQGLFHFSFHVDEGTVESTLFALRGYAWPFILTICKTLGMNTQIGYYFFYAVFIASGLVYAVPEFIEMLFKKNFHWFIRLIPTILTICFWNGLIIYPLSDVPAVITVTFGLIFLIKLLESKTFFLKLIFALLSGIFLGGSYYIRSGCKPVIVIAIIIIMTNKLKKEYLKKLLFIFVMCIGIIISTIPQILINISCNNIISYKVPIFITTKTDKTQYYDGFKALRYETNVSGIHPEIAMISYDSVIDNILAVENIAKEDVGLFTIIKLMIKYPMEFIGLYATKFGNYIDPRYGNELYITKLNSRQYFVMFLNYILWFLTFLSLGVELNVGVSNGDRSQLKNIRYFCQKYFLFIFAFILPALIHLLGTHVEARYFYPCYILMYVYLSMLCPWKKVGHFLKKRFITVFIVFIAFFGCLNAIWNFTFESFNYSQLLLEDDYQIENISINNLLQNNNGNLEINYDIWTLEIKNDMYLDMSGYIFALDKDSTKSIMTLVLSSENKQYMYDVNLSSNPYAEGLYKKSKFSIKKELAGLDAGDYQIGFILKNASESKLILSDKLIKIEK